LTPDVAYKNMMKLYYKGLLTFPGS